MAKNDGGPAFPRTGEGFGNPTYDVAGMSLRDYFAAKAMQARIANPSLFERFGCTAEEVAVDSYKFADALIAEREK